MIFVKVAALRDNQLNLREGIYFESFLKKLTTYPIDLIKKHIERIK